MSKLLDHITNGTSKEEEKITIIKEHDIVRKGIGKVYTAATKKTYRIIYDKRVIQPDFNTVPYGY